MRRLINILVLSCKKATVLIEKSMHFSLSPLEKIQLFLHTGMCEACKGFNKDSVNLVTLINKYIQADYEKLEPENEHLSNEVKQRILKKLEEKK